MLTLLALRAGLGEGDREGGEVVGSLPGLGDNVSRGDSAAATSVILKLWYARSNFFDELK